MKCKICCNSLLKRNNREYYEFGEDKNFLIDKYGLVREEKMEYYTCISCMATIISLRNNDQIVVSDLDVYKIRCEKCGSRDTIYTETIVGADLKHLDEKLYKSYLSDDIGIIPEAHIFTAHSCKSCGHIDYMIKRKM